MNGKRPEISGALSAAELRRLARREPDRAAAARMQAIAGVKRRGLPDMERQALRDAVLRYNAEGLLGLHDRIRSGGALSQNTAGFMVFELVMAPTKTWQRLRGEIQLLKVVQDITFRNDAKVINTPA